MKIFYQDPNARLDYAWDWSGLVGSTDRIQTATITAMPAGLVVEEVAHDGVRVLAYISGGQPGQEYVVTCRIITREGRRDDRSIILRVEEQ